PSITVAQSVTAAADLSLPAVVAAGACAAVSAGAGVAAGAVVAAVVAAGVGVLVSAVLGDLSPQAARAKAHEAARSVMRMFMLEPRSGNQAGSIRHPDELCSECGVQAG